MTTKAQRAAQKNRNTIFVEDGVVVSNEAWDGDQHIQRIRAPKTAAAARAGSFVHVRCDESLPMRRPLSIMRASDGWIEILYKTHGEGLRRLAEKSAGDVVSVMGPIGKPFELGLSHRRPLLIGGGVGIPPMVFIADTLRRKYKGVKAFAILGSEIPFPFRLARSSRKVSGLDTALSSTMPLLESWGIPTRLTSLQGFDGCYRGYVTQLADEWLATLDAAAKKDIIVYACGPTPMLKAVAELADRHQLPCQVSLEEYMACAVGGCAGCAVRVETDKGPAMKRVCVDGPVFDAKIVDWETA